MDYRERIEGKVGILFQIADQYLSDQISLEDAKERISYEMVNIRPAQFEAMKAELAERLKEVGNQAKSAKLFELFKNYLPPPYHKLQAGHPLRNYYEENSRIRSVLLKIDEMESRETEIEDWKDQYELLSGFAVHIKRMETNFYPLLVPMGIQQQAEKAKDLGNTILMEVSKNLELLKKGDIVDFLFYQRGLSQILMNYLDLEERVLYAKALMNLTDQDFVNLRKADDKEGYIFIEQPEEFVPKEKKNTLTSAGNNQNQTGTRSKGAEKGGFDPGMILHSLLATKDLGIIYYTPSGEIVSTMGNQIGEKDLHLSEHARKALLNGSEKRISDSYNLGNHTFQITCSLVLDRLGMCQGILKIKEEIGLRTEFDAEIPTNKGCSQEIDAEQNIAELFHMYPKFQEDFFNLDEELIGLKGPMGMSFLKDCTVEMVAKSLRIDAADLVDRINNQLKSY